MKHTALLVMFLAFIEVKGADSLTNAQVYNVQIGDTFDYRVSTFQNQFFNHFSYERYVVTNRILSVNGDTLFISRSRLFPLPVIQQNMVVTLLNSFVISSIVPDTNAIQSFITSQDTSFNGRTVNYFHSSGQNTYTFQWAEGLGETLQEFWQGVGIPPSSFNSTRLVYYSKGTEHWGTPYYLLDGSNFTPFIGWPEKCLNFSVELRDATNTPVGLEQFRAGLPTYYMGHKYVSLFKTYYNLVDGSNYSDSLMGFYRNDSLTKTIAFRKNFSSVEFTLYDFSIVDGQQSLWTYVHVDTITYGGLLRTSWKFWTSEGNTYCENFVVGGIGTIYKSCQPFIGTSSVSEHLLCFSQCDGTIYPALAFGGCSNISANQEVSMEESFRVFPTICNTQVYVLNPLGSVASLSLYSLIGAKVYSKEIVPGFNTIPLSLSSGTYLWEVTDENLHLKSGKLVVR